VSTLVKHRPGQHDQKDHGLWAKGIDPADVPFQRKQDAIANAKVIDLDALRSAGSRSQNLSDLELAQTSMRQEFDRYRTREMDRLRAKWEEKNPGEEWSIGKVESQLPQLAVELMTDDGVIQAKRAELAASNPEQQVRDAFTQTLTLKDGRTLNVVVDSASGWGGNWSVSGHHEVGGITVGRWQRDLNAGNPGEEYVYNGRQSITPSYQNLGIAGLFNDAMESVYIASGFNKVKVQAADLRDSGDRNALAGAFVWAIQGFDWASGSGAPGGVREAVRKYAESSEYRALPAPIQASIDSVRRRYRELPTTDPDYPSPREIATLGMLPGESWWPGKAIMNHNGRTFASHQRARTNGGAPGWNGEKILSEGGLRVTEGQVLSYGARQIVQNNPEMMAAVQRAFGQRRAARGTTSASRSEAARRAWETRRRNAAAAQLAEQQRQAAIAGAA